MDAKLETTRAEPTALKVGVIMRRERVQGPMSRWQTFRWVLSDVVMEEDLPPLPATGPSGGAHAPVPVEPSGPCPEGATHWLYPGFEVQLHRGDVEGYYLNLSSLNPCFWVLWRLEDEITDDALPQPLIVTLSYNDAGRWLDAQERVDQVPAPAPVVAWMARFIERHHQPEPRKQKRRFEAQALTDRFGNPVRISTEKIRRGGDVDG